jgi:hypothetical protein
MPYTARETVLLEKCKLVVPPEFITTSSDEKILVYIDLVINDINWCPPMTNYNRNSIPDNMIVIMGTAYFSQLFKQMSATLEDFNYNDSGLTVQIDQVGKINVAIERIMKVYVTQTEYMKKHLLCGEFAGLGSPRYQSQLSQFIKIALGSSFNWGSSS